MMFLMIFEVCEKCRRHEGLKLILVYDFSELKDVNSKKSNFFDSRKTSLRIRETEFVLIVEASARAECLHFLRCYQMLLRKTVLHDGEIWNFLAIFKIKNLISVLYIVFKTESDFQNFTVLICHFKCFLDLEEEEH